MSDEQTEMVFGAKVTSDTQHTDCFLFEVLKLNYISNWL